MVVPLSWGPRMVSLHQKGIINPGPRACDRKVVSSLVAALSPGITLSSSSPFFAIGILTVMVTNMVITMDKKVGMARGTLSANQ